MTVSSNACVTKAVLPTGSDAGAVPRQEAAFRAVDLVAADPEEYLHGDEVIDVDATEVQVLARSLRRAHPSLEEFARVAFEHVRDRVAHSWDARTLASPSVPPRCCGRASGSASARPTC